MTGTALAVPGVSGIGDPALLHVIAVAILLGIMLAKPYYGFAGGFHSLLVEDSRAFGASFIVPAVVALVVVPVGTLAEGYGWFVASIGLAPGPS